MKISNTLSVMSVIAVLMLLSTIALAAGNDATQGSGHDFSDALAQDISSMGELALQSMTADMHLQSRMDLQENFAGLQLKLADQMPDSIDSGLAWRLNVEITLSMGVDNSMVRNK